MARWRIIVMARAFSTARVLFVITMIDHRFMGALSVYASGAPYITANF